MNKIYKLVLLLVALATFTSCTYTFPEDEQPTAGMADFTKYVAVGNSLSAGIMNGTLYDESQTYSFPNLIAQQMQSNGSSGAFYQPDINAVNGYFGEEGTTILGRLHLVNPANPMPKPILPGQIITPYKGDKTALNNFGVPGLRVIYADMVGYGLENPYFGRFASNPNTATVLGDAVAANGTFFTYWLGSNDALGYALAGATGSTSGTLPIDLSPVDKFEENYNAAIDKLLANGSKGIVANVPSIIDIPHFTHITWDMIPMDEVTAAVVNASYKGFNDAIRAYNHGLLPGLDPDNPPAIKRDTIGFSAGQNGIVITDTTIPDLKIIPTIRQAKEGDLITLTAGNIIGTLKDPNDPTTVIGVGFPLGEEYTLTRADQEAIAVRIAEFNAVISAKVNANKLNLALLDINTIFAGIAKSGTFIHGAGMDATISPPFGAFSLDGVHPNPRGSAYIASLFIDQINESFGSNIPNLNPNNYPGNELPIPE